MNHCVRPSVRYHVSITAYNPEIKKRKSNIIQNVSMINLQSISIISLNVVFTKNMYIYIGHTFV